MRKIKHIGLSACAGLLLCISTSVFSQGSSVPDLAEVRELTLAQTDDATELELVLSESRSIVGRALPPANGSLGSRFFVDIPRAILSSSLRSKEFSPDFPVRKIRYGQNKPDLVRVVLDLHPKTETSAVSVIPRGNKVVFRIIQPGKAHLAEIVKRLPIPEESQSTNDHEPSQGKSDKVTSVIQKNEAPKKVILERKRRSKFRVVLDAGHGGQDLGAKGQLGTLEKDVCLKIAMEVRDIMLRSGKFEVFMIRDDDTFVPLNDRTRRANEWRGDVFVSIHANASPRKSASGVSTYFLNNADDEESLRVAMRENATIDIVAKENKKPEDYYLDVMKTSMVKNFHTVQSTDLARNVHLSLYQSLRRSYSSVTDMGVRSAKFFVLMGVEMPSILVETSFISNKMEERRLRSTSYRSKISYAIYEGVRKFLASSVGEGDHAALYGLNR